jgi:hypothetical protein
MVWPQKTSHTDHVHLYKKYVFGIKNIYDFPHPCPGNRRQGNLRKYLEIKGLKKALCCFIVFLAKNHKRDARDVF